jgi:hypothetical protein
MATASPSTQGEAGILDRLLDLERTSLSAAGARSLLTLQFSPTDRVRMHDLALKSQEDTLTPEDQRELESYRRIGLLLSLLKSKVRKRLKTPKRKPTKNGRRK